MVERAPSPAGAAMPRYAIETKPALNILGWRMLLIHCGPYAALGGNRRPTRVLWGGKSHPAISAPTNYWQVAAAKVVKISQEAHFMISTMPGQVAPVLAQHVCANEKRPGLASGFLCGALVIDVILEALYSALGSRGAALRPPNSRHAAQRAISGRSAIILWRQPRSHPTCANAPARRQESLTTLAGVIMSRSPRNERGRQR